MKKALNKAIKKAKKAVASVPAKKTARKAAKKAAKKVAAARKRTSGSASANRKTTVAAKVDIGYGNLLYIRGDAPGLSWAKGVPMENESSDKWSLSMVGLTEPFEYKLLVNDIHWDSGSNAIAKPGRTNTTEPSF